MDFEDASYTSEEEQPAGSSDQHEWSLKFLGMTRFRNRTGAPLTVLITDSDVDNGSFADDVKGAVEAGPTSGKLSGEVHFQKNQPSKQVVRLPIPPEESSTARVHGKGHCTFFALVNDVYYRINQRFVFSGHSYTMSGKHLSGAVSQKQVASEEEIKAIKN